MIIIDGWYEVTGPYVKRDGSEIKNLKYQEIVIAKAVNEHGAVFVQGLESKEYTWVAESSLTKVDGGNK